mmetsp:Transcript_29983/g.59874  ORF Transcript_29983/g.59874 Transcript_29983/m.59874 type:complete len:82 (+) Transcript_29983:196-441(+)
MRDEIVSGWRRVAERTEDVAVCFEEREIIVCDDGVAKEWVENGSSRAAMVARNALIIVTIYFAVLSDASSRALKESIIFRS